MRVFWRGPGWAVVLIVAMLVGVTAVMVGLWLPAAVAAGIASGVAIVAGVWTSRSVNSLMERDKQRRGLPGLILLTGRGRLPKVRDLDDAVALGVHPAADAGMPEFISRDITPALCEFIRRDHFVLIVGESTAGKSRAAYEAMRAVFPDHWLIQPAGKEGIPAAVQTARDVPRGVLWLDDLERFLGPDGLTGAAVSGMLAMPAGHRLIMATMRAEEYAKYSGRAEHREGPSRDAIRRGWEVLRLATRLTLPRTWSLSELERAAQHRGDDRIREALEHSDRFGVAEYLAAGPQLFAELQDAWAPAAHPRAAALVLAATDARRVGIHRPLSLSALDRLHRVHLERRGGQLLRPESLEEALAWATTPLHATSSLLLPADGGSYLAFDYLIDAVDKDPISPEVLTLLLDGATPEESMEIGEMAWRWNALAVAEAAFRQAQEAGHIPGAERRCHLIRERDCSAAGLRFAQRAFRHQNQSFGPGHPDTVALASLVAWEAGHHGDPAGTVQQLERLLPQAVTILGAGHETTLGIRYGIAYWTGMLGDHVTAAELCSHVAADSARMLGDTHRATIFSREGHAREVGKAGDWDRAILLLRELLRDMETQQQHPHDLFDVRSQLAYRMTEAEAFPHAMRLWNELAEESLARNGRLDMGSLSLRAEYAACVGEAGDPEKAVALLQEVMADVRKLEGPPSTNVLYIGRLLATWTGRAGDPSDAVRQFDNLITIATKQRGTRDGWTVGLRRRRAHWVGEAGDPRAAIHQLQQLTVEADSQHDIAKDVQKSLTHWNKRVQDDGEQHPNDEGKPL